jgi:hypothetical protein
LTAVQRSSRAVSLEPTSPCGLQLPLCLTKAPLPGSMHFAITWSGSSFILYVDSVSTLTGTTTLGPAGIGSTTGLTTCYLNKAVNSGQTGSNNGFIDDFRVYNRAIT